MNLCLVAPGPVEGKRLQEFLIENTNRIKKGPDDSWGLSIELNRGPVPNSLIVMAKDQGEEAEAWFYSLAIALYRHKIIRSATLDWQAISLDTPPWRTRLDYLGYLFRLKGSFPKLKEALKGKIEALLEASETYIAKANLLFEVKKKIEKGEGKEENKPTKKGDPKKDEWDNYKITFDVSSNSMLSKFVAT